MKQCLNCGGLQSEPGESGTIAGKICTCGQAYHHNTLTPVSTDNAQLGRIEEALNGPIVDLPTYLGKILENQASIEEKLDRLLLITPEMVSVGCMYCGVEEYHEECDPKKADAWQGNTPGTTIEEAKEVTTLVETSRHKIHAGLADKEPRYLREQVPAIEDAKDPLLPSGGSTPPDNTL